MQGFTGDCFVLAPLAGAAAVSPQAVAKMIQEDGPNRFTVRFPGAKDRPISLTISQVEMRLFAATTKYGAWPTILEKAFAQLAREDKRFQPSEFRGDLPGAESLDAGGCAEALHALTGNVPSILDLDNEKEGAVKQATKIKELLDSFSDPKNKNVSIALSQFEQVDDALIAGHVYTIMKVDADSVTVRNPWGIRKPAKGGNFPVRDERDDGCIMLKRDEFIKRFARVAWSKFDSK